MAYQLAGYFVMRLNRLENQPVTQPFFFTICTDFNDSLLDAWVWDQGMPAKRSAFGDEQLPNEAYGLTNQTIIQLNDWVEPRYQQGGIIWPQMFADLAMAIEYRDRFFNHLSDTCVLGLYFREEDVRQTLQQIPGSNFQDAVPLWTEAFSKALPPDRPGKIIGYDILGLEVNVLNLDSFLVHALGYDLQEEFGVELNDYGLLSDENRRDEIMAWMNDPGSPVEPWHWYWTQVRLFA